MIVIGLNEEVLRRPWGRADIGDRVTLMHCIRNREGTGRSLRRQVALLTGMGGSTTIKSHTCTTLHMLLPPPHTCTRPCALLLLRTHAHGASTDICSPRSKHQSTKTPTPALHMHGPWWTFCISVLVSGSFQCRLCTEKNHHDARTCRCGL